MRTIQKIMVCCLLIIHCCNCSSQNSIKLFIDRFRSIELPIDDIQDMLNSDTLEGKLSNDILIRNQTNKPQYIDIENNLKIVRQYYGLYPEESFNYTTAEKKDNKWIEVNHSFQPKIIPIGSIVLNPNYNNHQSNSF